MTGHEPRRAPPNPPSRGRLEVICGPMFSGKTSELIRRLQAAAEAGDRVIAIKPRADIRCGPAQIATHTGRSFAAVAAAAASGLHGAAGQALVIGVEEAHFYGPDAAGPLRALVAAGKRVIVVGVEIDHRGRPFEPFATLLPEAHEVTRLTAICARCGAAAIHSQRLVAASGRIVVGGAEAYEPRCEACFEPAAE